MLRSLSWLALAGGCVLWPASSAPAAADGPGDPADLVGKPAPEISGDFALNGPAVKVSDLKGKVVVVNFWAVWCQPCRELFGPLDELSKKYGDKGLEIVGVTPYQGRRFDRDGRLAADRVAPEGERALLKEFVTSHKLGYRVLLLPQHEAEKVFQAYKVRPLPCTAVIDRKGNLRAVKVGNGKDQVQALDRLVPELLAEKE